MRADSELSARDAALQAGSAAINEQQAALAAAQHVLDQREGILRRREAAEAAQVRVQSPPASAALCRVLLLLLLVPTLPGNGDALR